MSYLTATVHRQSELIQQHSLRPTWVEKTVLEASRKLTGRYPFYQKQNSWQTALHLLLNGLAGGSIFKKLKFLGCAMQPGVRLAAKRLLFQWPATVDESGRVIHCQCCPDAVLKDGHLVPLCISDLVVKEKTGDRKTTLVASSSLAMRILLIMPDAHMHKLRFGPFIRSMREAPLTLTTLGRTRPAVAGRGNQNCGRQRGFDSDE